MFVLADAERLANAEIGVLLGLSLVTVKSHLHQARLKMRQALAPYLCQMQKQGPPLPAVVAHG
jgi:DNA-directed RNA polymerase specialized sigma24 family protein